MKVYIHKDGKQYGPFTVEQIRQYVQKGNFTTADLACHDGQNWVTIAQVPGFAVATQPAASPSPTAPRRNQVVPKKAVKQQPAPANAVDSSSKKKVILWSSIGGIAVPLVVAGLLIWLPGNEDELAEDKPETAPQKEKPDATGSRLADLQPKEEVDETTEAPKANASMASTASNWWGDIKNVDNEKIIEDALREILEKPKGPLTETDLLSVKTLDLNGLQISDVTLLARLTNLTELYVNENQITDLTPLASLTQLTTLWIGGNYITIRGRPVPLPNWKNLKELDLESIQISDLTTLKGFVNLEVLFLNDNRITDLSPLAGLTNLSWLGLGYNRITDLSPLAGLTKLKVLDLSDNQFADDQRVMLKKALPNCKIDF